MDLPKAAGLAKLLRVADPRSGARLCEAQHCPQFSRCPRPIRALAAGNTAAGRRPALRDGRFMESPDAIFSPDFATGGGWAMQLIANQASLPKGLHQKWQKWLLQFMGCVGSSSLP
ncbi:MAG: hypothetical protein DMG67_06130 [Acidobacteria bacterium]|nr:MAG: hypothetical protein DMG67_06130 [Acidobacteriota bacterium]